MAHSTDDLAACLTNQPKPTRALVPYQPRKVQIYDRRTAEREARRNLIDACVKAAEAGGSRTEAVENATEVLDEACLDDPQLKAWLADIGAGKIYT